MKQQTGFPSIDKPWLKYYSTEAIASKPAECSIYQNIYRSNKDHPNEIAILYFGKMITYRQFFAMIEQTAKALLAHGVKCDDNVVLCASATPETLTMILALNRIGANAVMLNPTFTEDQLVARASETNARLMFVLDELYPRVKNILPRTSIREVISCPAVNSLGSVVKLLKKAWKTKPADTLQWNKFVRDGGTISSIPEPAYDPQRSAIMVFSSGTTGTSKGIQLSNGGVNATINEGEKIGFTWKRQDRYLAQIPIWFSTGLCATILVPLTYGITVILEPLYDFAIFADHISKYRPNFLITATSLFHYLMTHKRIDPAYQAFSFAVAGGEYVTASTEAQINEWLSENNCSDPLYKGYGMCEFGGTVTASSSKCNPVGSAGIPTPHVVIAAFDLETGKEQPYGQRGEIRVLTPCHMKCYYNRPEETAKFFVTDENGHTWGRSGDMGYVLHDGSVYINGRLSDSYRNASNEIIYLFDVERAAMDLPSVRQCKAVTSVVNGQQTHVAHVVWEDGKGSDADLQALVKHCREVLPAHAVPPYIKVRPQLPVAPSGKLDIALMQQDVTGLVELR